MKKLSRLFAAVLSTIMIAAAVVGCSSNVPANTVFSIDDLPGKVISVQLRNHGRHFPLGLRGTGGRECSQIKVRAL